MSHMYNVKSPLKFTPPPIPMLHVMWLFTDHLPSADLASYFHNIMALCHNHPRDSALPGKNRENHK